MSNELTDIWTKINNEIIDLSVLFLLFVGLFITFYIEIVLYKRILSIKEKNEIAGIVFLTVPYTVLYNINIPLLYIKLNISNSATALNPLKYILFEFGLLFVLFFVKTIKELWKGFSFRVIKSNLLYFSMILFSYCIIGIGGIIIRFGAFKISSTNYTIGFCIGVFINLVILKIIREYKKETQKEEINYEF